MVKFESFPKLRPKRIEVNWKQSIDKTWQYKMHKCNKKCIIVIQELQMIRIKEAFYWLATFLRIQLKVYTKYFKCVSLLPYYYLY